MPPQPPASPDAKPKAPAPVPSRLPPEEKFWQHYSPHHEFPLSSICSVALHLLGLVLVGVIGFLAAYLLGGQSGPPPVRAVIVDAGGGGNPNGVQGGTGAGGEQLPAEEVGPSTPKTEDKVDIKDVDVTPIDPITVPEIKDDKGRQIVQSANDAVKRLGAIDKEARSKIFGAVGDKGQGGSGRGGGKGSGEGTGQGSGTGAGKALSERQKRLLRWSMTFNTESGEDYLRQLRDIKPGTGAILAIPVGNNRFEVIRDLATLPAKGQIEDIGAIHRISWVDDKPESVAGLARALGIKTPPYFIAFFPQQLEEELARLETEFAGRKPDDIEETRFAVERTPDGYHARVVAQTPKR